MRRKVYTFGRFLETRLPQDPRKTPLALDAETVLAYYRLDLIRDGPIALKAGEDAPVYGPTEAGMKRSEPEEVKLSEIIESLNERFGTDFEKADQLAIDSVAEELKADEAVQQHASGTLHRVGTKLRRPPPLLPGGLPSWCCLGALWW